MHVSCLCSDPHGDSDEGEVREQVFRPTNPSLQTSRKCHAQGGTCYFMELNFGEVAIDTTVTKLVHIQNDTKASQVYKLQASENNLMYNPFFCRILCKQNVVKPNEIFQCKITYKPTVPDTKSFHKFEIADGHDNKHFIIVTGESVSPTVQTSVKYLNFYLIKGNSRMSKQIFELRNTSPWLEVVYQFENYNRNLFTLDKYQGIIPVHGKVFVTVKFSPKNPGHFADKLWCLVKNQEPVVIELFGLYQPYGIYDEIPLLKRYPVPIAFRSGVTGYLQDKIHLSKTCLYFENTNFHTLLLRNDLHVKIRVEWADSKDNLFEIEPKMVLIHPRKSFAISCKFIPKATNKFYSQILSAQIYWAEDRSRTQLGSKICFDSKINYNPSDTPLTEHNVVHVPFCLSLRCVGHTIQEDYHSITQIDISPEVIILPPCSAQMTTSTTFLIKCLGSLPTLYKIIPPSKTYVSMQPIAGVIEPGQYQIIVVQFCPNTTESFCIQEDWKVSVYGQSKNVTPIIVKLQCNIPSMVIGDNNKIRFPCIQVGWKEDLYVYVKNNSVFEVKYTFIIVENKYLEIEPSEGYIGANQEFYVKMTYTGNTCSPRHTKMICKCQVVHKHVLTGKEYKTFVTVHTKCSYSQLCALPSSEDFGEIKWNTFLKTKFHAFNFGIPPINFQLIANNIESEDIRITPSSGRIKSGEKVLIHVELTAKIIGKNKITISYGVLGTNLRHSDIFTIEYTCVHSVIQVDEITDHNMGPLFTKSVLWDLLNIDLLNYKLRNIHHGDKESIVCNVPDCEVSANIYYITLLLSNNTNLDMGFSLHRVKLCNCEAKETKSLTFRKKVYCCPHREMLKLNASRTEIKAHSKGVLTIEIKYLQQDLNQLRYTIGLTDNRTIELTINIFSIGKDVSTLSAYKPSCCLELKDVFVGEMNPPMQAFWVYNNSVDSVTYHVDTLELVKLRNSEGFEILKCLNPVDLVEPYNSRPIVFRFHPVEVQQYRVSVPFLLGDKVMELKISGKGSTKCICSLQSNQMPAFSKTPLDFVNISVDKLDVLNLPVWSSSEKIIFIRNNHKEHVFQYTWNDVLIEGVLKVTVSKKSGSLQPKETHRLYIQIMSLGEPCATPVILSCKLFNLTQYTLFKDSLIEYERKVEECSHYFTITEKKEITPVTEISRIREPQPFYATIEINIEIISSRDAPLHTDPDTLFKHTPRKMLEIDNNKIMREYQKRLTIVDRPIEAIIRNRKENMKPTEVNSAVEEAKTKIMNEELREVISETMTLLIGEVVFSEACRKVIEMEETDVSTYYSQYDFSGTYASGESNKRDRVKLSEGRARETERFLNYPRAEELSSIMKELLDETFDIVNRESGPSSTFLPTFHKNEQDS